MSWLECERIGKTGRFEVPSVEKVRSPDWVADELGIQNGSNVLERENVFYADDDPVYRVTTYVPWGTAKGTGLLQDEISHKYGVHGIFEDKGFVMPVFASHPDSDGPRMRSDTGTWRRVSRSWMFYTPASLMTGPLTS
jgi:hypothetical protein